MERQIIYKRINGILDDLSRLQSTLFGMNMTDIQHYPENYEILATDAALRSEQITCRLRHLIYSSTTHKKASYLKSAASMQGIQIESNGGILEITLPSLLPKRKQWQSAEFLTDPLYNLLNEYSDRDLLQKFNDCVVCFISIYCRDLPDRRIRDYDNVEQKQILDVIATFCMIDDSGQYCDTYNATELGENDSTRILIMQKDRFPKWLEKRQKQLKSISDF